MEQKRARIRVFGRVQGVFFRKYARDKARQIGDLQGYVRNMPDSSVEIVVEGEKRRIDTLVNWCKTEGSPWSKIQKVEVTWEPVLGNLPEFRISY